MDDRPQGDDHVIKIAVDTICYHMPLEAGRITIDEIVDQTAQVGADALQLDLHEVRAFGLDDLARLRQRVEDKGVVMTAHGGEIGSPRKGLTPDDAVGRIKTWLERAHVLGSPILRFHSGFYRSDIDGSAEAIEAERQYMMATLRAVSPIAAGYGIRLAVENTSDFVAGEFLSIFDEVQLPNVGIYLDITNPLVIYDEPVAAISRMAPLAIGGDVKDFALESIWTEDNFHRRGFKVLFRYPGEGVTPIPLLIGTLQKAIGDRDFMLGIEGLDSWPDVIDQPERLTRSISYLRSVIGS
jgi:sugar phosphate isomerase/epimerase